MFLTKNELKTAGVLAVISKVTNKDDSIITDVIDESIDEMKGYLAVHYDAEAIFNARGDTRSKTVLKYLKKIVIYELYKRKQSVLDDDTISSYEDAMLWLKNIAKGILSAKNLPVKQEASTTGNGFIKFGSNKKYSSKF